MSVPVLVDKRVRGKGHVALMRRAVSETLRHEGVHAPYEVSVVLADDAFIHELNREYMGVDGPTDVLSFPQEDHMPQSCGDAARRLDSSEPVPTRVVTRALGDIVVSLPTVARQAAEHGTGVENELALMVIHATLHLLGYDHHEPVAQDVMWRVQTEILTGVLRSAGAEHTVFQSASSTARESH